MKPQSLQDILPQERSAAEEPEKMKENGGDGNEDKEVQKDKTRLDFLKG